MTRTTFFTPIRNASPLAFPSGSRGELQTVAGRLVVGRLSSVVKTGEVDSCARDVYFRRRLRRLSALLIRPFSRNRHARTAARRIGKKPFGRHEAFRAARRAVHRSQHGAARDHGNSHRPGLFALGDPGQGERLPRAESGPHGLGLEPCRWAARSSASGANWAWRSWPWGSTCPSSFRRRSSWAAWWRGAPGASWRGRRNSLGRRLTRWRRARPRAGDVRRADGEAGAGGVRAVYALALPRGEPGAVGGAGRACAFRP